MLCLSHFLKNCLLAQTGEIFARLCVGKMFLLNIPRVNFSYGFIDLSNIRIPFLEKSKSFSVKGFYLNFTKKSYKCIHKIDFHLHVIERQF